MVDTAHTGTWEGTSGSRGIQGQLMRYVEVLGYIGCRSGVTLLALHAGDSCGLYMAEQLRSCMLGEDRQLVAD